MCIAIAFLPTEPGAAQGLHRDPRSDRVDDARLLADGLAGEGLLHRHGHQDLRLHPRDVRVGDEQLARRLDPTQVRPILAGSEEQGGGVRRRRHHRRVGGAARQLYDQVLMLGHLSV